MNDRWSGSIRLSRGASADRIFDEQLSFVRDLLARQFPASGGYEIAGSRLSGPLEGVHWSVRRGAFAAELGVQRFARARSGSAPRRDELRFVASAGHGDACATPSGMEHRVIGWAMAGWGLSTVALGGLWLGSQGLLTGWAQLLLLIPAAATWRATVGLLARRARRTALPAAPARTALPAPQVTDGLRRWRELLPVLATHQQMLESACGLPPFRNPHPLQVESTRVAEARDSGAPMPQEPPLRCP